MTPFVVVNPVAGGGRARRVHDRMRRRGAAFASAETTGPGDATRLARAALDAGHRHIVACGGDGTLHEVLQAIVGTGAELAFLPAGTSCDFARAIAGLAPGAGMRIDVIRIDCLDSDGAPVVRYAANGSSVGLVAEGTAIYESRRGLAGLARRASIDLGLIAAALTSFARHEPFRCHLAIDASHEPAHLSALTVFKTPFLGGGMRLGTSIAPADGRMGVVTVAASRRVPLGVIASLYRGTLLARPDVRHAFPSTVALVEPERRMPVEADGEIVGFSPVRYTLMPGAVQLFSVKNGL